MGWHLVGKSLHQILTKKYLKPADRVTLQAGKFTLGLPPEKDNRLKAHNAEKVIVGIRPEDFTTRDDPPEVDCIPATIYVIEPIGNETYVNVLAGDVQLTAAVGRRADFKIRSTIYLVPIIESIHLSDIQSEEAIY